MNCIMKWKSPKIKGKNFQELDNIQKCFSSKKIQFQVIVKENF